MGDELFAGEDQTRVFCEAAGAGDDVICTPEVAMLLHVTSGEENVKLKNFLQEAGERGFYYNVQGDEPKMCRAEWDQCMSVDEFQRRAGVDAPNVSPEAVATARAMVPIRRGARAYPAEPPDASGADLGGTSDRLLHPGVPLADYSGWIDDPGSADVAGVDDNPLAPKPLAGNRSMLDFPASDQPVKRVYASGGKVKFVFGSGDNYSVKTRAMGPAPNDPRGAVENWMSSSPPPAFAGPGVSSEIDDFTGAMDEPVEVASKSGDPGQLIRLARTTDDSEALDIVVHRSGEAGATEIAMAALENPAASDYTRMKVFKRRAAGDLVDPAVLAAAASRWVDGMGSYPSVLEEIILSSRSPGSVENVVANAPEEVLDAALGNEAAEEALARSGRGIGSDLADELAGEGVNPRARELAVSNMFDESELRRIAAEGPPGEAAAAGARLEELEAIRLAPGPDDLGAVREADSGLGVILSVHGGDENVLAALAANPSLSGDQIRQVHQLTRSARVQRALAGRGDLPGDVEAALRMSEHDSVRARLARSAGGVEELERAAADNSPAVHGAVVSRIDEMDAGDQDLSGVWSRLAGSPDEQIRRRAAESAADRRTIVRLAADPDPGVRRIAEVKAYEWASGAGPG